MLEPDEPRLLRILVFGCAMGLVMWILFTMIAGFIWHSVFWAVFGGIFVLGQHFRFFHYLERYQEVLRGDSDKDSEERDRFEP